MSAIQVKNVPEDLHEALRRRAAPEGTDLQGYLLRLIRRDLAVPSQAEWWADLDAQPLVTGTPPAAETLEDARAEKR